MKLNQLSDNKGATKSRKRVGRGPGSGIGKTGGRGLKGQKSRSGVSIKGFEGGQMPIYMRLPKRGFNVPNPKKIVSVNLGILQKFIDEKKINPKEEISENTLVECGLVRKKLDGIKILGKGSIKSKVTLKISQASKSAISAVEKVGGNINTSNEKSISTKTTTNQS